MSPEVLTLVTTSSSEAPFSKGSAIVQNMATNWGPRIQTQEPLVTVHIQNAAGSNKWRYFPEPGTRTGGPFMGCSESPALRRELAFPLRTHLTSFSPSAESTAGFIVAETRQNPLPRHGGLHP